MGTKGLVIQHDKIIHKNYARVLINCIERSQQAHYLDLRSIYAKRSDHETIQSLEIDFGYVSMCPRANGVDESFEGILCDDNFVHYKSMSLVCGYERCMSKGSPQPLLPDLAGSLMRSSRR